MSAGMAAAADGEPFAALAANRDKTNKLIDPGSRAARMIPRSGARTLHQALDGAGIKHTYIETEGAHHWRVWRRYLRDLSPLLFTQRRRSPKTAGQH